MKLILAEKPSVAREIATVLGVKEKKEGYIEGNGYAVSWALGHLISLAMPQDYGVAKFDKDRLPLLPNPFILIPRQIKKDKITMADPVAVKQLKIIEQLLKRCDSIIVATDAGREGELIFRYIYQYLECYKPFERLWISSLTEKAIRCGFDTLKPGAAFDGLYHAGESRSHADWLVGINASQALSIAAGYGVYSLGRVQTPTLALICKRYLENKDFSSQKYWQIQLEHRKGVTDFKSISVEKWEDKKVVEKSLASIQRHGSAIVTSTETKPVKEQPPLLFDLTGLQKEANKKLNLTAEETLSIAQGLYENKFITYPRTGSKYIPADVWQEIPVLLRALDEKERYKESIKKINWSNLNRHIVNDLKVTDHHGLLITDKVPDVLNAKDNAVYEMIAFRLLEAVSQVCEKEITTVALQALHYDFVVKASKITELGWRSIQGNLSEDNEEVIQELPELAKGDELKIKNADILEKKTKPPALYTEASLLSAMESAGKKMESEEERKILQQIGIGTPATRAAIIETLFDRTYIKREKKSLIPTDKGLQVYNLVKDKKIADVAMTAEWELGLQKIETGEADAWLFQKEIEAYAIGITQELLSLNIAKTKFPEYQCPKCQAAKLFMTEKVVKCPDENCSWTLFRNICGVQLDLKLIEDLLTRKKTSLIKGFKSKSDKSFNAFLVLNSELKVSFEFEPSSPKNKQKKK